MKTPACVFAALLLVTACRSPEPPAADVVARLGQISITTADLDQRVLALPADKRAAAGSDVRAWLESQAREAVLDRFFALGARERGVDAEARFLRAAGEVEERLVLSECLARLHPQLERVTTAELEAELARRHDALARPEQRFVLHLFRRAGGSARAAATTELEALRDQVLQGAPFRKLAQQHSDSESRHRQGELGWVRRGELPGGFDAVVFALAEGVPSDPLVTRDGVHLFLVDQISPERRPTLDEFGASLGKAIVVERREAAVTALAAEADPQAVAGWMTEEGVRRAVAEKATDTPISGEPHAPTVADLLRAANRIDGVEDSTAGALRALEAIRRRALAASACGAHVDRQRLSRRLEAWREAALARAERQHRLHQLALADDTRLREYYESNAERFAPAPTWKLRQLLVSEGADPRAKVARLEAAARANETLDQLATELGGEITELDDLTAAGLTKVHPKLPVLVAGAAEGSLTPPLRGPSGLLAFEVVARTKTPAPELEPIRDRVAASYTQHYAAELYRRLSDEIIATEGFEIFPDALDRVGLAGPGEVSVEDLEALFADLESDEAP